MPKSTKIFLALAILLIILAASVVYYSSTVFLQLFIAFVLAYILNPAVELLERKGVRRLYGIMFVFCLTIIVCSSFTVFLVVSMTTEFSNMPRNLPAYVRHLYDITPASIKGYLGIETPDR
ncbi:MAG: AI-2E family transporter, partial [Desulfuromonadaceae bacterium]